MSKETMQSYAVLGLTALTVIVFHILFIDYPYGWPFAVFVALLTLVLIGIRAFSKQPLNLWSFIFLVPVLAVCIAQLLYANPIVRGYGFILVLISEVLFAYWLFAPKTSVREVPNFWPQNLIFETLLPFGRSKDFWRGLSFSKDSSQVLVGLLIAVPFVLVFFGLFMSADALVSKIVRDAFAFTDPGWVFAKLIMDFILAWFLIHFLWTAFSRSLHARAPHWSPWSTHDLNVAIGAFLSVLNLLFLGFIAFQFVYFFGGQAVIEAHGLTYAIYARQGFFQLFTVSLLVFGVIYGLSLYTRMRPLAVRLLSLGLLLQAWVVIASGVKRLTLYVDAYGLSVLRFWALAGFVVIALGLLGLVIYIVAQAKFETLTKAVGVAVLFVFSGLLLLNVESLVVSWNADRSQTERVSPDFFYPYELSSDAVPAYVAWLKTQPNEEVLGCYKVWQRISDKFPYPAYSNDRVTKRAAAIISIKNILNNLGRSSPFLSNGSLGSAGPDESCDLGVWKTYLKEHETTVMLERLKDGRAWTWSDVKAYEALKSL